MEPIDTTLFGVVHRKRSINSKRKGNENELNVSHLLSRWTGHEFVRVPMSGGLRWGKRVDICGDVINVDKEFEFFFNVETKFVKNLGLQKTKPYVRVNSCIYTFMKQCTIDAIAAGKKPFLMVRENGMQKDLYYIFLPINIYSHMELLRYTIFQWMGWNQDLGGFRSDIFFKDVSYETLKQIYK